MPMVRRRPGLIRQQELRSDAGSVFLAARDRRVETVGLAVIADQQLARPAGIDAAGLVDAPVHLALALAVLAHHRGCRSRETGYRGRRLVKWHFLQRLA